MSTLQSSFTIKEDILSGLKKLASDTVIYGITTIVPRFLNYLLVTIHTGVLLTSDYGIMAKMFAWVGIFMAILTYGMETSYFRFASKEENSKMVFSTTSIALAFTSTLFFSLIFLFSTSVANFIGVPNHVEYVTIMAAVLAFDAFTAIPFAKLRLDNRPFQFMFVKFVNVGVNIGLTVFFLWLCPRLVESDPNHFVLSIFDPEFGVGYVFLSNLFASALTFVLLLPQYRSFSFHFDRNLMKKMLNYGFPILLVSLAGMLNLQSDKILMTDLLPEGVDAESQLGIYGACLKITVILTLFTQAFKYAFEPFFFSHGKDQDKKELYADVLKYFMIFCLFIFLGVNTYLDIFKLLISENYHEGLSIVPVAMMASIFSGAYYSMSLWYKISDNTKYGAYLAIGGAIVTIALNVILVPKIGYMGAAIAMLISWFLMCVSSYIFMRKIYPIEYDIRNIGLYFLFANVLFFVGEKMEPINTIQGFLLRNTILIVFLIVTFLLEQKSFAQKYLKS